MEKENSVLEIVSSLETGLRDLYQSDKYKEYLKVMGKFHHYSLNNSILIYSQYPEASMVAGYEKWKEMGRNVKKGEKGIHIIAPTLYDKKVKEEKEDPKTGEKTEETKTVKVPGFKRSVVFDISQTEGKPLPKLVSDIKGDVSNYDVFLKALTKVSPVPVSFGSPELSEDGRFDGISQKITLKPGLSERQTLSALIHEITHSLLHNEAHPEYREGLETEKSAKSRNIQEVEAESVSFAVCSYYGIDTSENSLGYIASWSEGKDGKELRDSLSVISDTASAIIRSTDREYAIALEEKKKALEEIKSKNPFQMPEYTVAADPAGKGEKNYFVGKTLEDENGKVLESILFKGSILEAADLYTRLKDHQIDEEKILGDIHRKALPTEAVFSVSKSRILSVSKRNDGTTFDYSFFDKNTLDLIDGGITSPITPSPIGLRGLTKVAEDIAAYHGYRKEDLTPLPGEMLDKIYEHELAKMKERLLGKAVPKLENREFLKNYPKENFPGILPGLADPTTPYTAFSSVGYRGEDLLAVGKYRAESLLKSGVPVYLVAAGNQKFEIGKLEDLLKADGAFGIDRKTWEEIKKDHPISDQDVSDSILKKYESQKTYDAFCLFQPDVSGISPEDRENPPYFAKLSGAIHPTKPPKENEEILKDLRDRMGMNLPSGYLGRPIHEGDIISLKRNHREFHYKLGPGGNFTEISGFERKTERKELRSVFSEIERCKKKISPEKTGEKTKNIER